MGRTGHRLSDVRTRVVAAAALASALAALGLAAGEAERAGAKGVNLHEVVFAGNNWEGTASVLDPAQDYENVATINIVPDKEERETEIMTNPADFAYFLAIRQFVGEGNDQYVDDMYTTPDGSLLIVSRPSFKDVIGLDLADCTDLNDCPIAWRFEVAGQRSDHMGITPDGQEVAVSASTGNVVHVLDTQTGQEVDQFPSGDSPHENTYSESGKRLYHASIGRVYTPNREGNPALNSSKGERVFRVINTSGYSIREDIDVAAELEEKGRGDLSEAVRPMAIPQGERKVYFQVSFFHGFIVYSFRKDKITRIVDLPKLTEEEREQYLLNSAHHGIAINGKNRRLCIAGTMDDYAAFMKVKGRGKYEDPRLRKNSGTKPYWATTSEDGRRCYVSWSGTDSVSIFNFRGRELENIPVGDHPQRVRTGTVTESWLADHT